VSGPFEHVLQAKMSIHYNVAAALRHGNFDEANYVPQQNTDVLTIATKTRLEIDDELTKAFPALQGAEVIVQTRAGDELRERAADVVPADESQVRARFAAAAAGVLGEREAARLAQLVDGLERVTDAAELSLATRLGSTHAGGVSAGVPTPRNSRAPHLAAARAKRAPAAARRSSARETARSAAAGQSANRKSNVPARRATRRRGPK
jgi:hypothetical protein